MQEEIGKDTQTGNKRDEYATEKESGNHYDIMRGDSVELTMLFSSHFWLPNGLLLILVL